METGRAFEELLRSTRALLMEANGQDLTQLTESEIVEATALSAEVAKDAAMAAGRLSVDHVRLLANAHRADAEAFLDDEDRLIDPAQRLLFSGFERVIRYWIYAHASDDAARRRRSRQRRADVRAPQRHRRHARLGAPPAAVGRCGPGDLRGPLEGDRRRRSPAPLRRCHPHRRGDA
ncbi:MAG: hypothetical protein ACT452_21530 [Microthrixaceae bacterium]